jgi:aspartate racemase
MKTIGLIGGTGWVSTIEYYRFINQGINKKLGALNSAHCLIYSFNYEEIDKLVKQDNIDGVYPMVLDAAHKLQSADADFIVLGANTLHMFADKLETDVDLPIVHITDATAGVIKQKGFTKVGLLGTRFTMEMGFYSKRLKNAGIETITPEKPVRDYIHDKIINEMLHDNFTDETREEFISIINELEANGAEGIVLGCTEIPLLVKQKDVKLPLFNTLEIHADAVVNFAVGD